MGPAMGARVACTAICKHFGGILALDAVTVDLSAPSVIAIIGPNGAGKSTLFDVFSGFVSPDSGRCFVADCETTALAPEEVAQFGLFRSFQRIRLLQSVAALENVLLAFPLQIGERISRMLFRSTWRVQEADNYSRGMKLLSIFGLEGKAKTPAGDLSYGQQRLLGIACGLATEASILLLDEPFAGIDPGTAERVSQLFAEIRARRLIIFIEHDLARVKQLAERVIVMDQGKVIEDGRCGEVLKGAKILKAYLDE